ncbi:hypothetical protein LSAT2_019206, partial [Lamellibrachia satsuma]
IMRNVSNEEKCNVKVAIVEENVTAILGLRGSEVIKFITVNESNVMNASEVDLLESCSIPQTL